MIWSLTILAIEAINFQNPNCTPEHMPLMSQVSTILEADWTART